MTVQAERAYPPAHAETLPDSQEVYNNVIKEALQYSVLELGGEHGVRRSAFYEDMGVRRTGLVGYNDDLGKHRGFDADQSVQPTGAYKDRAAAGAVLATEEGVRAGHVASAGNAGAAYARMCGRRGMRTRVHCARTASSAKLRNIVGHDGAEVDASYDHLEDAQVGAELTSISEGAALYHPFDREAVIAGNATLGFEMVADLLAQQAAGTLDVLKDPIKLFVPIGGGGLIAGVAVAVKWAKDNDLLGRDNVQVIGVQMEGCDAMKRTIDALHAGQQPAEDLFASGLPFNANSDGTAVRKPGRLTTAIVADPELVADIVLVSEGELGWEMRRQYDRTGKKYEPAGMLARTAAKKYAQTHPDDPEVLLTVTSGANVSDGLYDKMTKAGLDHMLRVWSIEREQQARNPQRRALAALGNTGMRLPQGEDDYGVAPAPIYTRQPAHRGAVLSGTFPRW